MVFSSSLLLFCFLLFVSPAKRLKIFLEQIKARIVNLYIVPTLFAGYRAQNRKQCDQDLAKFSYFGKFSKILV